MVLSAGVGVGWMGGHGIFNLWKHFQFTISCLLWPTHWLSSIIHSPKRIMQVSCIGGAEGLLHCGEKQSGSVQLELSSVKLPPPLAKAKVCDGKPNPATSMKMSSSWVRRTADSSQWSNDLKTSHWQKVPFIPVCLQAIQNSSLQIVCLGTRHLYSLQVHRWPGPLPSSLLTQGWGLFLWHFCRILESEHGKHLLQKAPKMQICPFWYLIDVASLWII